MHKMIMQKNYVKAYKLVILLAVVLAVLSAVAVPPESVPADQGGRRPGADLRRGSPRR